MCGGWTPTGSHLPQRIDTDQAERQQRDVDARIAGSDERDELWQDVVLTRAPFFDKYAERSGRVIPIAVLTPRP